MLVKLRDLSGSTVMVNSDHVLFIAQAADEKTKKPLLGQSVIFLAHTDLQIVTSMTPEDVAAAIDKMMN